MLNLQIYALAIVFFEIHWQAMKTSDYSMTYNRGNNIMEQFNFLVLVWFTTSKAGLDFEYGSLSKTGTVRRPKK